MINFLLYLLFKNYYSEYHELIINGGEIEVIVDSLQFEIEI